MGSGDADGDNGFSGCGRPGRRSVEAGGCPVRWMFVAFARDIGHS